MTTTTLTSASKVEVRHSAAESQTTKRNTQKKKNTNHHQKKKREQWERKLGGKKSAIWGERTQNTHKKIPLARTALLLLRERGLEREWRNKHSRHKCTRSHTHASKQEADTPSSWSSTKTGSCPIWGKNTKDCILFDVAVQISWHRDATCTCCGVLHTSIYVYVFNVLLSTISPWSQSLFQKESIKVFVMCILVRSSHTQMIAYLQIQWGSTWLFFSFFCHPLHHLILYLDLLYLVKPFSKIDAQNIIRER